MPSRFIPSLRSGSRLPVLFGMGILLAAAVSAGVPRPTSGAAGALPATLHLTPTAKNFNNCCYPLTMAAADLTGNGALDIVAGNGYSRDITILLNDGNGNYADPVALPLDETSLGRVAVALADLDGDGHPDLVATAFFGGEILVYRGDGAGGFLAPAQHSAGTAAQLWDVVLADVTGDGKLDIVAVDNEVGQVSVLAGDGAGGFAAAVAHPTGSWPVGLAVADVTGDGHVDIVTINSGDNDVSVLAGDGGGQFAAPVFLPIGSPASPQSLVVADLDGDGIADIVTANMTLTPEGFPSESLPGTLSVIRSNGDGTYVPFVQYPAGPGKGRAHGLAVLDIDGNGHVDIVTSRPNANGASVLAGDGNGGFAAGALIPTAAGPNPLLAIDTDGDGHLDIVTGNAGNSSISVLPGNGSALGFAGNTDVGAYPHAVASADLDGDGHVDVVTANMFSNDISILFGRNEGGFTAELRLAAGASPASVAIGDFNGDGHADLAVGNLGDGTVSVLLGDGNRGFGAQTALAVGRGFEGAYAVALADANGDGHLDIATANASFESDSVSFLAGDGSGQFANAVTMDLGAGSNYGVTGIAFADATGDGHVDIVTANLGNDSLSLFTGDGGGQFASAVQLPVAGGPAAVTIADVTGDGVSDLVTINQYGHSITVLAGTGSGGFAADVSYPIYPAQSSYEYEPWSWALALADLDGDGALDVVTANTQNNTVSVLVNDGSGQFAAPLVFATGAHPGSVAVADVDGDGRIDVITANRRNDMISVLFNTTVGDAIFANGFD